MKLRVLVIGVAMLWAATLGAEQYRGKEVYLLGNSAEALGRAGTGTAASGADLLYLNPASIGDAERIGLGVQYGTLPLPTKFIDAGGSLAVPTSYGVFGASFRYLGFPDSKDLETGYAASMASARDLTRRLLLGFSLDFFHAADGGKSYYAGGAFGFIYTFPSTGVRHGFCIKEPRLGLAVHFGYPFGKHPDYADSNRVNLGYRFTFFSMKHASVSWYNDFTVMNYKEFPVKFGLEAEFVKIVTIRGGFIAPRAYNEGAFTAGLGLRLDTDGFNGTLNYAINFYPSMKFTHYLGVNCLIGRLDQDPPVTGIRPDSEQVSPNRDGVKDFVLFKLGVTDRSRIKGWRLQVLDAAGRPVKDYSISEHDAIDRLTVQAFFRRIFQKRESTVVPEKIIWDGTNTKGQQVPDGAYTYSFSAWDERDNIAAAKTGEIIVDNTPPEVSLEKADTLFSPNGDGRKDTFIISQRIKAAHDDVWSAGFTDEKGNVVKSYRWTGNAVPARLAWDGKDDGGNDAPEGLFGYFIECTDAAGNRAGAVIREVTLTRKYEIADISLSAEYVSFGRNGTVNLFPSLSSVYGLTGWKIAVLDGKKKVVRELAGERFEKMVTYDCTDEAGKRLDDGAYAMRFTAFFASGNAPESYDKRLIIDSTPPKLGVSHSPGLFSPDGDRENDLLTINPTAKDFSGIRKWTITIYSSSGDAFKAFSGTGAVPESILWDGLGDNLDIVESAADYSIVLEAEDMAGNTGRSKPDRLEVDVLVLVTERGLKIRISNIEFAFGSHEIRYKGKAVLDRVYQILQKYERYDILIEGHTDDVGKEEFNLELSERRARAVNDYLLGRGIRADRLRFVGMGETVPLYPNDSDEHRRRNRRVEFMLMKAGAE